MIIKNFVYIKNFPPVYQLTTFFSDYDALTIIIEKDAVDFQMIP